MFDLLRLGGHAMPGLLWLHLSVLFTHVTQQVFCHQGVNYWFLLLTFMSVFILLLIIMLIKIPTPLQVLQSIFPGKKSLPVGLVFDSLVTKHLWSHIKTIPTTLVQRLSVYMGNKLAKNVCVLQHKGASLISCQPSQCLLAVLGNNATLHLDLGPLIVPQGLM